MINPISKLSDLLNKLVIEHGSAVITKENLVYLRDQLSAAEKEIERMVADKKDCKTIIDNLTTANEHLKKKIDQMINWGKTEERYQLEQLSSGAIIYALKPEYRNSEPVHAICPSCFGNKEKSILQPLHLPAPTQKGIISFFVCHKQNCKLKIQIS